jgi:plastocyanin
VVLIACALASGGATASACASASVDERPAVTIANDSFSPSTLRIPAGATVTWANHDVVPHRVSARDGLAGIGEAPASAAFASGPIAPGGVYVHRFTVTGRYTYVDVEHVDDQALGTVIVEAR